MNKKISLLVLALVAFANIGLVKAQTTNNNSTNRNNSTNNSSSIEERNEQRANSRANVPSTEQTRTITGTIQSMGADSNSFVIRVGNRNISVTTTNAALVRANRSNINFADMRVGDRVTVTGVARNTRGLISSIMATAVRDLTR